MSGFLYYLPGARLPMDTPELCQAGLAYVFGPGNAAPYKVETSAGPEGQGEGIVVADSTSVQPRHCGYKKDTQIWRHVPKQKFWVGMYSDDRPCPQDLATPQQIAGHLVRLNDGNSWMVPVARQLSPVDGELQAFCALSHNLDLDEHGRWTTTAIVEHHRALWQISERFIESVMASMDTTGDVVRFEFQDMVEAAVTALAANYRVRSLEVAMLGLLTETNILEVLSAVVDGPTARTWLKKKQESDTGSSSDGQED